MSRVAEAAGRRSARFERDVLPHLGRLYSAALQMTDSPADAEDLVQDTFAKAYMLLHEVRQATSIGKWLYGILITAYMDGYQQRRPRQNPVGQLQNRLFASAQVQLLDRLDDRDVQVAVQSLPYASGIAVYLADVERFSYREIAGITRASIDTVKSRLHQGRRQLGARLLAAVDRAHPSDAGSGRGAERGLSSRLAGTP